jgi:hypothetical protein
VRESGTLTLRPEWINTIDGLDRLFRQRTDAASRETVGEMAVALPPEALVPWSHRLGL